jgi:hypothetical protein
MIQMCGPYVLSKMVQKLPNSLVIVFLIYWSTERISMDDGNDSPRGFSDLLFYLSAVPACA